MDDDPAPVERLQLRPRLLPAAGRRWRLSAPPARQRAGLRRVDRRPARMASYGRRDDRSAAWGKTTGPNPTNRGTAGTTRRLLADGNGTPLGVAGDGANRNATTLVTATVRQMVIGVNAPRELAPQRRCLDNGDDNDAMRHSVVA